MDSNPTELTLSLCYTIPEKIRCSGKAHPSVICRIRKKSKVALLMECGENSGRQLLPHSRKPKASYSTPYRIQKRNKKFIADFSALAFWKH